MNKNHPVRIIPLLFICTAVGFAEPVVQKQIIVRREAPPDDGPRLTIKKDQPGAEGAEMEKVAFLGVETMPVDPTVAAQLGLPRGTGVVVRRVAEGSPASNLLQPHDILTKLDDQILINMNQLSVLVRNHAAGDEVKLTYVRGGKESTTKAKLGEREVPRMAWENADGGPVMRFFGDNEMPGGAGKVFGNGFPGMPRLPQTEHDDVMRAIGGERMNWFAQPRVHVLRRKGGAGATILDIPAGSFVFSDDAGSIEVSANGGKRELTVKDAAGKVTFQGPLNTPEDRAKIPPEVRARIDDIGEGEFGDESGEIKIETRVLQPGSKVRFGLPARGADGKTGPEMRDL